MKQSHIKDMFIRIEDTNQSDARVKFVISIAVWIIRIEPRRPKTSSV